MKRLITFNFHFSFFSIMMFLFVFTAQGVWAQSGEWKDYAANEYASGDGSKDNPYVIKTAAQFAFMAKEVASTDKISKEKYYVLDADIDLGAHYWNPIGVDSPGNRRFYGKFDGKGHTIKNLKVQWIISGWTTAGLFGRVQGASNDWARISNLVIDGANIAKKTDGTNLTGNGCSIGILAGEVRQYSEISNIIVKNSVNSDGGSSFEIKNSAAVRIGGVIGNTEKDNDNNPGVYRIFNLAAENVKIEYPNMKYNSSSTDSYVGGIIGRFRQKKADDSNNIFAENLFSDVTINYVSNAKITCGSVLANKDGVAEANHWYYTKPVPGVTNYGENKGISFASSFNNLANSFVSKMNEPDMPYWIYTQALGFKFLKGTLTNVHESTHLKSAHVYTLNTTGNYTYEWYVNGALQSSTTKKATLNTKAVEQKGRVVVKNGADVVVEIAFVIPAEIYGVDEHVCATGFKSGDGTKDNPYIISNAAELAYLSKRVSDMNSGLDNYFALGADIDLDNGIWTPIGGIQDKERDNYTFRGKLDGRGHTISNMHVYWNEDVKNGCSYGLFSFLGVNAEVSNLIIDNAKVCRTSANKLVDQKFVGILAGSARENTKIRNVIVRNSEISIKEALDQNGKLVAAGGLIGRKYDGGEHTISYVAVQTNIDFSKITNVNTSNCHVGGVTGEWQSGNKHILANAYYMGKITNPAGATGMGNAIFGTSETSYMASVCTDLYYLYDVPGRKSEAVQKNLSSFGSEFQKKNNEDLVMKNLTELKSWLYDTSMSEFKFLDFSVTGFESAHVADHTLAKHTYTLTLSGANASDYRFRWAVGSFTSQGVSSGQTNKADLPTLGKEQSGTVQILDKTSGKVLYEYVFVVPTEIYGVEDHLYANSYAGGDGTQESPYIISNDLQFAKLALDINKGENRDKYYSINADIDLSRAIWTPIGSTKYDASKTFNGSLDGNGHTISNMVCDWYSTDGNENIFGLFSSIEGSSSRWCDVRNIIFDNARVMCDKYSNDASAKLAGSRVVGVMAGVARKYSNVQNIIIRNSDIMGASASFSQNGKWLVVGGAIGKLSENNNACYKLDNISADVKIDFSRLSVSNQAQIYVGGFIAECQDNIKDCINNIYVYGKNNMPFTCENVGSVFGNKYGKIVQASLYYVNKSVLNQGTQKALDQFAVSFCDACNYNSTTNNMLNYPSWNFNNADGIFFFGSFNTNLTIDHRNMVVVTATTPGLNGNEKYNWYISTDNKEWEKSNQSTTKILNLPYEGNVRYVYAEVADASSRSNSVEISTIINAEAFMTKTNNTYGVELTNTLWGNDNQYLTISYQWMADGVVKTTDKTYTPSAEDADKKITCHVVLSSGDYTILDKTVYMNMVVFLKPDGGNDSNDGMTPDTPVKTWQQAYSLLNDGASWDENKIVLMGRSTRDDTYTNKGFAIMNNLTGDNNLSDLYGDWKTKVNNSHLAKHATITGKHNNKDYAGTIDLKSNGGGLGLFGDTRFENITFNHVDGSYDILYCQYHNLEMGEGIQMTGYTANSPGYGTIDGARTASFQIFGGLNNDRRFRKDENSVVDMKQMEEAMPHGKEGFSITLKSGHYSCICVGGRQSNANKSLNGIMGTPNMPIKCTVTIDINRKYNDEHNQPNADYDCGIVMAGNHEGAMYADVDIVIKSGYIARVVNGTLGNIRDYHFNYGGNTYDVPNNSYMGRANIVLDPRDGTGNIDNSKVVVTELYGGSTGRGFQANTVVDNPFYGYSTVTINGGTFTILPKNNTQKNKIFSGIYGAGAGGINGVGNDDHHTADERIPYWSADGKVVLYGKYDVAKNRLVSYKCYNKKDGSFTMVDPTKTNTQVTINGGIFGSATQKIDGVYAGGSGYMSPGLWTNGSAIPSKTGGNVYGRTDETVSSLIINGGVFYCEHGVFAGGRGTDYYYSTNKYGGENYEDYQELGKTYGNVELTINGGTFNCDVFGGGYGVADAIHKGNSTSSTLENMARVYGTTTVTIGGNTRINGSVYGGGDMAAVDNGTSDATNLTITGNVVVTGNVFASGNGRTKTYTQHPELVGFVKGNANLYITGTPTIYGDIYGGGAYGSNKGNTNVIADGGYFYKNIYGGGQGDLDTDTRATIDGNASVTMSGAKAVLDDKQEESSFIEGKHVVYGGGDLVATVTGTAAVNVTRTFVTPDIMATQMWENACNDNSKRSFWVFGGGYGENTVVGNTDVNINIDIDENNEIIGSVGGAYAGVVEHNTSTTIQGTPILRNVYGGGYGLFSSENVTAGIVKENSTVLIEGGEMHCNVYGGGKGIPQIATDQNDTFKDVARVKGNTSVTVTGTAAIYGNVYGGGDIANVGDGTANYKVEPKSTSISNGNIVSYTHNNACTFVNITGGNIYGMVFGGGLGRVRTTEWVGANYTKIGRVTGNTLVHVANSMDADNNTVEPYIWNRIYGAGSYGVVDGNSMVHIEGGNLGYNIFGGGFGDAGTDNGTKNNGTYADVLGNTNVTIDGGSWIWYAMADEYGNITTWNKANTKLNTSYETMRNKTESERMSLIRQYRDSRFFEKKDEGYGFTINHNIYGGGNAACYVSGTSKVIINHSPLTDVKYNGETYNLLDPNTAAGCCWYTSIDNIRNPQFSVFGAGYGVNTKVQSTEVYAQPGAKLDANGKVVGGNKYVNQLDDLTKYVEFEQAIYDDYQSVDDNTRKKLYGMGENTNDPRTYLRYRASQLAWSIGAPAFTFMDIHGGGFSGYVTGNTKVITDCQLTCRSVFGGGIGSKPEDTPSGNETYGQVGGNTDVQIYGGVISMNVFGGGAGIEPYKTEAGYKIFPEMALVKGKTNVDVYGESYKISYLGNRDVERTLIFGSVYGGGDVANVGTTDASEQELTGTESYTTKVNIKGASVMSPVFAGGNGRPKSTHYDYTKIGAVYGNAGLFVDKADKAYPYASNSGAPATAVIPYLWNCAYGGGNKGIINGNTLVKIDNGYFSDDIFAGGLGDATQNTSADITGHTNLIVNGGEAKLTSLWNPETRAWTSATTANNHLYSPQYDPQKRKFKVNHNIYGGGNLACVVSGNSYITMSKGLLNEQETVSATANPEGGFFATKEWKEVYYKTGSPYFCVFGGGYGNKTIISGNTYVNVNMVENGNVHLHNIPDRVEGEEYLHFIPGQAVMDIVGGGYEGKVLGETNVNIGGGTFARRIFGGGQYNSVLKSNVNIASVDCEDVFGGGMMGDVEKTVNVNVGTEGAATNDDIHIHGNVYGGNDVAGYVNLKDKDATGATVFQDNGGEGVKVKIRGGHIYGNVYGAGNGDYLYALDKAGNASPTVNEYYRSERNIYDLVYTVPMRSTIASSSSSATDAQKIVNLNSWRPLTNKVTVDIAGKNANSKPDIRGYVYGGGNSATVVATDANSHVTLNVGSNIKLGGLFLGCDGDQLFTQKGAKDYMRAIKDIDGIDLNAAIDWNLAANKNIKQIYVPADNDSRAKAYPHILDLYFQPVSMSIRPVINWATNLKNDTIGSFVCGGNRGNMDVKPDQNGNAVNIEFPEGLTITDKIVGGCYNANYDKNNTITVNHVGGYLLGSPRSTSPMINLLVKCKFAPSEVEKAGKKYYEGGNVYGGCYKSGVIVGDVKIDYRSNSLDGLDASMLAASNEKDIAVCNVYGAGYGESSYVYGDINVLYSNDVPWSNNARTTVNNIFGGGEKGNVIGNTDIRILNGKVLGSVTGGSYSGNLWGSTQVLVGYPTYYLCKKNAKYDILRADDANLALENINVDGSETKTIKQSIYLMRGDIVSEQVVDAVKAYDAKNGTTQSSNAFEKKTISPSYTNGWNDVNIQIGVAVYGGGYSTSASGSSALTNTTVLKYTKDYNNIDMKFSGSKESVGYANGMDDLTVETVQNYGGNTTMLIADDPSYTKEHITISPQTMKVANGLTANSDLFRYYYKDQNNEYHYISEEGKYFKKGPWPEDISSTDHNFYVADTDGGIFGDGHLSYTEGFRNCELTGYGYAEHTINAGKILNTFQRMDMLRLKDNCVKLLGARDYATNSTDVTPYSISRVGEIQMMSSVDGSQPLYPGEIDEKHKRVYKVKKVRNYLGLSNNIRYVGAIKTDDEFSTALWHGKEGELGKGEYSGKSYRFVKDDFLKYHEFVGNNYADKNEITYQKRNEGTARNLIGIASGYSLKIRNVQEHYDSNGKLTETAFYGPIVGVAEIRLVDINADEAGGYVYADNRHASGHGYHDFIEETGNFVFPYVENPDMYVVDDCFPNGWEHYHDKGLANGDLSHCWFLTGYHFYLNANISAYTFNSAGEGNGKAFESNSEIALEDVDILKGLMAGQQLKIESWELRSDHPNSFSSDLEVRNYQNGATDHSGYNMNGKYKLYVSISDKKEYTETEGIHYELTMDKSATIAKGTPIPGSVTTDVSRLAFKLVDNVDNTSTQYYKDYMELPTKAALVLRTPALRLNPKYGQPGEPRTVPDKSKMAISVFYTKNGDSYNQTTANVPLHAGTAYYFRNADTQEYELFYDGTRFLNDVMTKTNDRYSNPLVIGDIEPTNSNVYYLDVPRSYTYTIYLNIEYIQGPSPEGNITIANCALPGEYIKVDASSVTIDADQSMRPQSFYWRIGKLNAEGTGFVDAWNKDVGTATYETWRVGSEPTGIFTQCEAVGNDVLYVPAYYFMNGYGVQYGFISRKGNDEIVGDDIYNFYPIEMKKDAETGKVLDRLEVHNFHMMDSHEVGVDLHLSEAVERAKNEPMAQPRIYIGDEADLKAFATFVKNNQYHGANAQFVLLNDLTIPNGYVAPDVFAGTLHGDGYVITGGKLFKKNSGNIYNLGVVGGKIADTNMGRYSCCFEGEGLNVYDIDGNAMEGYTEEDFRYGKVAYDLNQYHLKKAGKLAGNTNTYTYVEDYYRNGDYQYARVADETLGVTTGVTYLRMGNEVAANQSVPYYHIKDMTAHDVKHTADIRRKGDHCEPLFEENDINDYRYFGQGLQADPELYPSAISSHKVSAALNRVWRTDGYYGSKETDKFYYNAAIHNENYMDTYVVDPRITAVNFNVADDNASVFHGFATADDVTRNLLVYTPKGTSANNEVADVVSKSLSYSESLPEGAIRGHQIIRDGSAWKASMLHLVDKQTFNAPIAFSVTGKSWYVRNPETETGYVDKVGTGWESICLPFTVDKSTLSEGIHQYSPSTGADLGVNKNITFFYGTPAEGTTVANNNNTLRHHYWFREFKSISGNKATFERPEKSIANGGFAAYTPYIVSFPGNRYYEFDMTGQTVTFEKTNGANIAVTDDAVAAASSGKPYHIAFANDGASSSKYAIAIGETGDDKGMKFERYQPIYAFRGYIAKDAVVVGAKANSISLDDDDVIYISTDIRTIENLNEDENSSEIAGEYLRVYDAGNHTIGVESSYDTKLTIYTSSGQIARILDVRAGTSKYSGFASGIYIIGQKKLSVK